MIYQHRGLAEGRWQQLSFIEQMANIGSEVGRALSWRAKDNPIYCQRAFERALELIDLTLEGAKGFPRLKELTRLREALVDYFYGENEFMSSEASWNNYFHHFLWAARKNY